jgi:hypothetical protein
MRWVYRLAVPAVAVVVVAAALVWWRGGREASGTLVSLDQVPAPLVQVAKDKLPQVKFDHAWKLPNGDYEIRGKDKNGKVREVEVTPAGDIVEVE